LRRSATASFRTGPAGPRGGGFLAGRDHGVPELLGPSWLGREIRGPGARLFDLPLVAEAEGDAVGHGGHARQHEHPREEDEGGDVGRGDEDDDERAQAGDGEDGGPWSVAHGCTLPTRPIPQSTYC